MFPDLNQAGLDPERVGVVEGGFPVFLRVVQDVDVFGFDALVHVDPDRDAGPDGEV